MSTSRGSTNRKRPQKHQNRTAFKNNLHDTSHKTKTLNSLQVCGVCKRCKDVIEWKIKYKKYKPLTAPAKCVGCEQKAVKSAYHVLCSKCASEKNVCAKCCKPAEVDEISETVKPETSELNEASDIHTVLKSLPERKRRTVLRYLKKNEDGQAATPEMKSRVDDILSGVGKLNIDDDFDDVFGVDSEFGSEEDDDQK